MFSRKLKILLDLETDPDIKVSGTYMDYHALLEKRLKYLQNTFQQFKSKHLVMVNKNHTDFQYNSGDLVYIISPLTSQLRTNSRNVTIKHVGGSSQLFTDDLRWKNTKRHERLKLVITRTSHGKVINLAQLKQVITLGLVL